jgi:hypothetical protein
VTRYSVTGFMLPGAVEKYNIYLTFIVNMLFSDRFMQEYMANKSKRKGS